jgi:hypothetical protein
VWTGTLGVLELPVNTSSRVELYLIHKEGKKYIPVPAYFWKVNVLFFSLKTFMKKRLTSKKGYFILYKIRFSRLESHEQNCLIVTNSHPSRRGSGTVPFIPFYIAVVKPFSQFLWPDRTTLDFLVYKSGAYR